jgi:N-acyl-D-aspartate/D-glutamate deacylase
MADLLVRGGDVVDGTGAPAVRADVRVRDGLIVEVGPDLAPDGEAELDAAGAVVTPGFIDIHTHYDGSLWWDSTLDPAPQQGVTSVVTGNCAISLAPVAPADRDALVDMFCFIEDLPVDAVIDSVPWTWRSWGEYRDALNAEGASCHVVPLVGHNNLRMAVLGDESFERPATDDERHRLMDLTVECLRAGAFGVSISFVDSDSVGRRVPSRVASTEELADLGVAIATVGHGIVQYVPRFMKADGYLKDMDRVDAICREVGITQTYAPLPAGRRDRDLNDAVMAHNRELTAAGATVWPQVSPRSGFDTLIVFDGSSLPFAGMFAWTALCQAPMSEKRAMLADPEWRARAREDWDTSPFSLFPRHGVGKLLVGEVTQPGLEHFGGRPFAAVLEARPGHPSDVLAQWVLDCDLETNLVIPGTADEDQDFLGDLLAQPDTLVGASDAGAHVRVLCGAGDTTLFLTRYVRDRGDLPLEAGVHKLTGMAAAAAGLRDRGVIAPGLAGDLVVFDPAALVYGDEQLVADMPGGARRFTRGPGGYRATVVGGEITQLEGMLTPARPGRMLSANAR